MPKLIAPHYPPKIIASPPSPPSQIVLTNNINNLIDTKTKDFKVSREYKIMSNLITQQTEEIETLRADLEALKELVNSFISINKND
jgi:hypothetical protein